MVMSTYLGIMGRVLLQNARFFSLLLSQMACELGQEVRFIVLLGFLYLGISAVLHRVSLPSFDLNKLSPLLSMLVPAQLILKRGSSPSFSPFPEHHRTTFTCSHNYLKHPIKIFIDCLNYFPAASHN